MANNTIIGNFLGGLILTRNGAVIRNWKFILYIFLLILLYITFHYEVRDTMLEEVRNEEILSDLKNEYANKMSLELQLSKRGAIEERLIELKSDLVPPQIPPRTISKD